MVGGTCFRRPSSGPARRAPARCCSRPTTVTPTRSRLGIDVDLTVSGPTVRARVTQIFRNPTQGLGRGGLCLSAAVGRRGRYAEDGDRRPRRGRRHQGAAAGHASSTNRRKQNGQKAALTEQERPNIFTNSVANIGPGETVLVQIEYQEPVAAIRQRILAAGADGGRPALQSRARRAERRLPARRRRLGFGQIRSRAGPRPHLARSARPRDECAGQSDRASRCGCRPASRSARSRATITPIKTEKP